MSSGSSQQPVTTTQISNPPSYALPALGQISAAASGLYNGGTGYIPYTGPTQAPVDPATLQAMGQGAGMAVANIGGTPNVNAAMGLTGNMIGNQGLAAGQQGVLSSMGNMQSNLSGLLPQYLNLANAGGLSQGNQGAIAGLQGTAGLYSNLYNEAAGQQNPYLLSQIAANDRRIGDRVNSTMSGSGRYGSGAHTNVLARSLAEAADPILAQDYAQRKQQQLAASQGIGNTYGQISDIYSGGLGRQLQATQGQQSIMGQMGQGLGQMSDIYSGGLGRAGQFSQLAPQLDQSQYAGVDRLAGYGDFGQQRSQADLASQIQLYNAQQAYPWEQLNRYSGIIGGAGGLGGSKVTTAPNLNAPVGGIQGGFGGALAGGALGSMFGPVGAGVGALGGGLLGAFR